MPISGLELWHSKQLKISFLRLIAAIIKILSSIVKKKMF